MTAPDPAVDLRAATREFLRANMVNAKAAHDAALATAAVTLATAAVTLATYEASKSALREWGE